MARGSYFVSSEQGFRAMGKPLSELSDEEKRKREEARKKPEKGVRKMRRFKHDPLAGKSGSF
jgi:hypothetical protein